MASLHGGPAPAPAGAPSPNGRPEPAAVREPGPLTQLIGLIPVLVSILTIAGPLYPLGLLVVSRKIHAEHHFDNATAWNAALLLPKSLVVLEGVRYALASSAIALLLIFLVVTAIVIGAILLPPWCAATPNRWIRTWTARLAKLWGTGVDPAGAYRRWYLITIEVLAVLAIAALAYSFFAARQTYSWQFVWFFVLNSVPLVTAAGLFCYARNWFDLRASFPRFSTHLCIVVLLLTVPYFVLQYRLNPHALFQAPREVFVSLYAVADLVILWHLLNDSAARARLRRPLMFLLLFHLCTLLYVIMFIDFLPVQDDAAKNAEGIYIASLGVAVAAYIAIQIAFRNVDFPKWVVLALLFAYFPGLLPAFWLEDSPSAVHERPFPYVAVCVNSRAATWGELLNHDSGYWDVLGYESGSPTYAGLVRIADHDATKLVSLDQSSFNSQPPSELCANP